MTVLFTNATSPNFMCRKWVNCMLLTPDAVFSRVSVDYARPLYLKLGAVWKPTIIKAYVAVFISLTIKAVHLEIVSSLTTEAFTACLQCFGAHHGKPELIWSDDGTNIVDAKRVLIQLSTSTRGYQSHH